jgi:FrmR/RcnR family transcriptional regulator, repressor of frmRAB operon
MFNTSCLHFLFCTSAASPTWQKALPLELPYPFVLLFSKPHSQGRYTGCYTPIGWAGKMSHTSREKLDLVNRTKKVIGQLESVLRALNEDDPCADVLQRLSAARGAINSLMAELMEDHIRNHMPRNSKSSEEAADDVIQIVRTYLK